MAIDTAGNFNDGGVRFGSQVLSIIDTGDTAIDYIAESFSLERGANFIESKDENGRPNKQHGVPTLRTGSITLQLATTTTKAPKLFGEFEAVDISGDTVPLVVAKVGEAFSNDGETKVTIDVREVLN